MKKILIVLILLFSLVLLVNFVEARAGCCSRHGGVCGASCCDGSSLSAKCGGSSSSSYNSYSSTNYDTSTESTFQKSSSNLVVTPSNLIVAHSESQKKLLNESCNSSSECSSNYCTHSFCRNSSYFIGDKYCDAGENCLNSLSDCGSCVNNSICDTFANESCENSKDCSCFEGYICNKSRPRVDKKGCYKISCGDGFVDQGENSDNCCLDAPCKEFKSLIKETDDRFIIHIKEPSKRNLANKRIILLLAEYFKISKGKVRIISGHHSPSKIVSIDIYLS